MSLFANLKDSGLEKATDTLGGFGVLETGLYPATVKLAYAGKSAGGAMNVSFIFSLESGQEFRETIYVSNRNGENFYVSPKDPKKKNPLPGFTTVNDIAQIAGGIPLSEAETEPKVIKLMNWETRKEEPQEVPVLTQLLNKPVLLAIVKETVDKTAKNDATGEYGPTGESRDQNTIEKAFDPETRLTVSEANRGLEAGEFVDQWAAKNTGKTRDRRKVKDAAVTTGKPAPARKSLFGKK